MFQAMLLDRLLDAFLVGNTSWCLSVLAGVSSLHSASTSDRGSRSAPPALLPPPLASPKNSGVPENENSGVHAMSDIFRKGFLAPTTGIGRGGAGVRERPFVASSPLSSNGNDNTGVSSGKSSDHDGDPTVAALCLSLLRRCLQAGGADARVLAAHVGIAMKGQGQRAARSRTRRGSEDSGTSNDGGVRRRFSSGDGVRDEVEGGDGGGEVGGGGGGWGGVGVGPPLTPALEVAVRLFADGYDVAVIIQKVSAYDVLPCPLVLDVEGYRSVLQTCRDEQQT